MNDLSDSTNIIGFAAGIILIISYIPQLIKIIITKSAKDISILMYILILISQILWVLYGFLQYDIQIIWVNISCAVITVCILIITVFIKYFFIAVHESGTTTIQSIQMTTLEDEV